MVEKSMRQEQREIENEEVDKIGKEKEEEGRLKSERGRRTFGERKSKRERIKRVQGEE